ncbi:MAG: hypothetical protein CMB80_12595 [Flammeovirgaceae bacterium]|nr:hypothetical protein [Flammeovirgaceae bacterium]
MTQSNNMIICNQATMSDLRTVPVPDQTDTFFPTPHSEVVNMVQNLAEGVLTPQGFTLSNNVFGLARKGQRLFGMVTFQNGSDEQELAIAYRQGYDKTLPYAIACGTSVMICSNLDLSGEIVVAKKHTKNGWDAIRYATMMALAQAPQVFERMCAEAEDMKSVTINVDRGFEMLGLLRGHGVLKPVQLSKAFEEWVDPSYKHPKNSLWGLYNSCTEALKLESDPTQAMARRLALHTMFTKQFVAKA